MAEASIDKAVMYHYCNTRVWKSVNQGHKNYLLKDPKTGKYFAGEDFQGLWPSWRLIESWPGSELVPAEAIRPGLFGFPEATPRSWIEYQEKNTNVFDYLMSCCADKEEDDEKTSLILLEVDLLAEDDPFVVDYVHVRQMAKDFNVKQDSEAKRRIRAEGMKRYWESRAPLADYKNNFILPEVVTFAPVPKERIHFLWEKNLYQFLDEIHGRK